MKYIATSKISRETDKHFIETLGIPGILLMEEAAMAVTHEVMKYDGRVLILCGTGNNGGDGLTVLRQLSMYGREAQAAVIGDCDKIKGDAKVNFDACMAIGLPVYRINSTEDLKNIKLSEYSVVVDALFGTGLMRKTEGIYADVIKLASEMKAVKIAVDIPSGISSDDGRICGVALKADKTVTFQSFKRGHMLYPGREYSGEVILTPICVGDYYKNEFCLENKDICEMLPKRIKNSHKGSYGKLLIIAGSDEYAGAAVMSALAAQRSGVGLIKLVTVSRRVADELLHIAPEIMVCLEENKETENIDEHINWCDAVAIGMGLGKQNGLKNVMERVLSSGKKTLIDADGINIMAEDDYLLSKVHENCIFTPHLGEFSRLINKSISEISENMVGLVSDFAVQRKTNLLLKGSTSVIACHDGRICYNRTGNSGLSKGGSGDTLSGLIASLAAQGMNVYDAACVGAYVQGMVADTLDKAPQSMSATDISSGFSEFFKKKI